MKKIIFLLLCTHLITAWSQDYDYVNLTYQTFFNPANNTSTAIKKAINQSALLYHPDKVKKTNFIDTNLNEKIMQKINSIDVSKFHFSDKLPAEFIFLLAQYDFNQLVNQFKETTRDQWTKFKTSIDKYITQLDTHIKNIVPLTSRAQSALDEFITLNEKFKALSNITQNLIDQKEEPSIFLTNQLEAALQDYDNIAATKQVYHYEQSTMKTKIADLFNFSYIDITSRNHIVNLFLGIAQFYANKSDLAQDRQKAINVLNEILNVIINKWLPSFPVTYDPNIKDLIDTYIDINKREITSLFEKKQYVNAIQQIATVLNQLNALQLTYPQISEQIQHNLNINNLINTYIDKNKREITSLFERQQYVNAIRQIATVLNQLNALQLTYPQISEQKTSLITWLDQYGPMNFKTTIINIADTEISNAQKEENLKKAHINYYTAIDLLKPVAPATAAKIINVFIELAQRYTANNQKDLAKKVIQDGLTMQEKLSSDAQGLPKFQQATEYLNQQVSELGVTPPKKSAQEVSQEINERFQALNTMIIQGRTLTQLNPQQTLKHIDQLRDYVVNNQDVLDSKTFNELINKILSLYPSIFSLFIIDIVNTIYSSSQEMAAPAQQLQRFETLQTAIIRHQQILDEHQYRSILGNETINEMRDANNLIQDHIGPLQTHLNRLASQGAQQFKAQDMQKIIEILQKLPLVSHQLIEKIQSKIPKAVDLRTLHNTIQELQQQLIKLSTTLNL